MCNYTQVALTQMANADPNNFHVAILMRGRRILSVGQNDRMCGRVCGSAISSRHAEVSALQKYMTVSEKRLLRRMGICDPTKLDQEQTHLTPCRLRKSRFLRGL